MEHLIESPIVTPLLLYNSDMNSALNTNVLQSVPQCYNYYNLVTIGLRDEVKVYTVIISMLLIDGVSSPPVRC